MLRRTPQSLRWRSGVTGSVPDPLVTLPAGIPKLTLGWEAAGWAAKYIRQPNGPNAGRQWSFVESQLRFVLWWYAVDEDGRWLFHHGVRRWPKGAGKSPFAAVHALIEFCGPVRLDDWESDREKYPGGCSAKPVAMPLVQIAATAESQTANTMRMVRAMASKASRLAREEHLDVGKTIYYKPGGGQLEVITSSASAAEGAEVTFAIEDETEHWNASNGGVKLAEVLDRNLAKSSSRGVETANAWTPGEKSIAETTHEAWLAQAEGRTRGESRILYDSRQAPADTDLTDETSLMAGLEAAYGDCWWVDLRTIRDRIWDPRTKPAVARQFYLNQPVAATDSWLSQPEWNACYNPDEVIRDKDAITLGFDGSRQRARGVTDATALIGCRLSDGFLFELRVWEQPEGQVDWRVPVPEVEAEIREAFARFRVVGFYADPAKWESYIAAWEATYGPGLKVKATRDHPIEWWMVGGRARQTVRALEQFETAVVDRELSHDGSSALMRHILNARRRASQSGIQISKAHPDSAAKIDAAVAAVLAWQARLDAVAAGITANPKRVIPTRLR